MSLAEEFADRVFSAVQGYVARAIEPHAKGLRELSRELAALKLKEGPRGPQGEPGKDGADGAAGKDGSDGKDGAPGKDGERGLDGINGKDGSPGLDGKDGVPGQPGAVGERGEKGADGINGRDGIPGVPGERGIDGRDGREGKDGAPGRDAADIEILPSINPQKSYPAGTWAEHAGGLWVAKTATDGMTGWHCKVDGLAGIEVTGGEDGRSFEFKVTMSSGKAKSLAFTVPTMLDRGVWREGQEYEKGDTVSFGGSGFICQRTTTDKPETSDAWRLAVKRGRDGKDFGKK